MDVAKAKNGQIPLGEIIELLNELIQSDHIKYDELTAKQKEFETKITDINSLLQKAEESAKTAEGVTERENCNVYCPSCSWYRARLKLSARSATFSSTLSGSLMLFDWGVFFFIQRPITASTTRTAKKTIIKVPNIVRYTS